MNGNAQKPFIGAPLSLARYANANRICVDCFAQKPSRIDLSFACDGDKLSLLENETCYVCEQKRENVAQITDAKIVSSCGCGCTM